MFPYDTQGIFLAPVILISELSEGQCLVAIKFRVTWILAYSGSIVNICYIKARLSLDLSRGLGLSFTQSGQGCVPRSVVWPLGTSFLYHTLPGRGCLGQAAPVKLLMVSCLVCGVPTVVGIGGNHSGILRRAVHSQVHHDNSRHFRGNYQRVSLNNQFP